MTGNGRTDLSFILYMKICVYCSASNSIPVQYKELARTLGHWIASNGHTLLFGGATGGLMSEVSEGAAACGGAVVGVVPKRILAAGRKSDCVTELHVVDTMNERKALMKLLADVFVVLPGSYGTLDELFDVVASGTVGEHKKPLIILNYNHFYDKLSEQIGRMRAEAFIPQEESYKPLIFNDMKSCTEFLKSLNINPK